MCSYYNIIHITVPTCSYSRLCMVLPFVLRFGDQHDSWIRRATQWVGKGERGGHQHLLPGGYWISSSASAFITLRYFVADFLGSKKHFDRFLQQLLSYLIIDVAFQGFLTLSSFLYGCFSLVILGVIWFVVKTLGIFGTKHWAKALYLNSFPKNRGRKHPHVVPSNNRPKTARDFFLNFKKSTGLFPQKHPDF